MRAFIVAATLVCSLAASSAIAQTAPAHYTTAETDIGTLLDDPAAKAVLDKFLPGFSANDQVSMARPMTLKAIQQFSPDQFTDKVLADIDADLAKLPEKK